MVSSDLSQLHGTSRSSLVRPAQIDQIPPPPRLKEKILGRLKGKYLQAILVGLYGLIAGSLIGSISTSPVYRAIGTIEIQPLISLKSYDRGQDIGQSMFEAFVLRQLDLLQNELVHYAVESKPWLDLDQGTGERTARRFNKHLGINRSDRVTGRIELTYLDSNSKVAAAAVNAMIEAHQGAEAVVAANRANLEARHSIESRRTLKAQLAHHKKKIMDTVQLFGPIPIDQLYEAKLTELEKLEDQLTETKIALATMNAQKANSPDAVTPNAIASLLAKSDDKLRMLMAKRQQVERYLASLKSRMGDRAIAVQSEQAKLDTIKDQIQQRLHSAQAVQVPLKSLEIKGSIPLTLDELRTNKQSLEAIREATNLELTRLANRKMLVVQLKAETSNLELQIEALDDQLAQLIQSGQAGGVFNVTRAQQPLSPYRNLRPQRCMLGAVLGLLFGSGIVLGVALFDPRMLRPQSTELGPTTAPLLGTVPTISSDQNQESNLTALSIHEIRALIQIRAEAKGERSFAITSSSQGAGKTSLTVGLASSLALSGTKTLLVDCELASRVLGDATTPDESTPQKPLKQSLDEVMVEMGYLKPHDLDLFLSPEEATIGLLGMLGGVPLDQCVVRTGIPGLSILPALSASSHHIGKMSAKFIRTLIDQAQDSYDMILFDTGPIPGSVEALFVAGAVDGVIVVASRGEQQSRFNRTLTQLKVVGAQLVGTVFNRVPVKDLTLLAGEQRRWQPRTRKRTSSTRRVHREPIVQIAGSGILAAAVHAQSKTFLPGADSVAGKANDGLDPKTINSSNLSLADAGEVVNEVELQVPSPPKNTTCQNDGNIKGKQSQQPPADADHPSSDNQELNEALDHMLREAASAEQRQPTDPKATKN